MTVPGREAIYGPVVDPEALSAAAASTLKSMMGSVERIVLLFGWTAPGRGEEVSETIEYINDELERLRPWALRPTAHGATGSNPASCVAYPRAACLS